MDNEERIEFLRKQKETSDARFNETIYKIESILKQVAATQERTEKLLERSGPAGE